MATNTNTKARPATKAEQAATTKAEQAVQARSVDALVKLYQTASGNYGTSAAKVDELLTLAEQAKLAKETAAVWMARAAYLLGTHPSVWAKPTKVQPNGNLSGAAKLAGTPRNTFRPFFEAGVALSKTKRFDVATEAEPTEAERVFVQNSMDKERKRKAQDEANRRNSDTKGGESEGEGGESEGGAAVTDSFTASEVIGAALKLRNALSVFTKGGGEFTKDEAAKLESIIAEASAFLSVDA